MTSGRLAVGPGNTADLESLAGIAIEASRQIGQGFTIVINGNMMLDQIIFFPFADNRHRASLDRLRNIIIAVTLEALNCNKQCPGLYQAGIILDIFYFQVGVTGDDRVFNTFC